MRTLKQVCVVAILSIAVNGKGDIVMGRVSLLSWPTGMEIVEEFANSDARSLERAAMQIRIRQDKQGIHVTSIPVGAEVEIQTLPGLQVVGRGKVNKEGRFTVVTTSKDSLWRAYCRIVREEFGKSVQYVGVSRTYKKRDAQYYEANITLKRTYASVEGRCINKDGTPARDLQVLVRPITQGETENKNELHWASLVTVTDAAGIWRVDGIDSPMIDRLTPYICNTTLWRNVNFLKCPMALGVEVWRPLPYRRVAESEVANITDNNRRAAEKAIEIYEYRLGKKWDRPQPMVDFPASTNNVIYVPDIIIP